VAREDMLLREMSKRAAIKNFELNEDLKAELTKIELSSNSSSSSLSRSAS